MAEAGPTECETQKSLISNLQKTPLRKGDTWYLVDTKWYKQWKKYVGYDSWDTSYIGDQSAFPGPIDNSPLFKEGGNILKENLIDELEYVLFPEEAWEKLVSWYGLQEDQEPIARKVIEQGMFVKHCKVEVYLMDLKLCTNANTDNITTRQFSRADTIEHIEKVMRGAFDIPDDKEVRLWNKYMSNTFEQLNKPDNTVQDAGLYQGQVIVVEEKNEDGSWPRQPKTSTTSVNSSYSQNGVNSNTSLENSNTGSSPIRTYNYSGTSGYGSYYNDSGYKNSVSIPGICGLSNLGNTCFMNSAIQCMSNVAELTDYFLHTDWRSELNMDNPLGMKGEIATSYAELIRNMWSGQYSYTVPRNFKVAVGRFAPQFSGYQQQDSQELMAFLLDGLHEDLNRIKKKPYIEQKDAEGRPDDEVAKEAWDNYLRRNDSIIVDIFHGLLKSTLVCPECEKVSVTFDPFCYLSLPLPDKKERQIEVFFVAMDPRKKPKHYKLTVPQRGNINHLCKALSKLNGVPHDKMVVTDVYNRRFHKIFPPDESLTHILDRDDIFIYEIPCSGLDDPDTLILHVYMREKRVKSNYNGYQHVTQQLFGQPLLIGIPRSEGADYHTLYNSILNKMARYVKIPDDNEEWWKSPTRNSWSEMADHRTTSQNGVEVEMTDAGAEASKGSMASAAAGSTNSSSSRSSSVEKMENGGSTSTAHSEATDNTGADGEDDDEETDEAGNKKPPGLFVLSVVNSFGTTEMEVLADDGQPLALSARSYVAVDWHPKAKAKFYDEKAAEELEVDESVNARHTQKKQTLQLTECIDLYTTTERLGEHDPWYCPRCKKHQRATKKFDLWQLPRVLVIHLKRFSYNRYWRDKLDTFIEYPTKGLNMKKWILSKDHGPALYDLVAVTNHYGGMGGGHYTAYGKNHKDNRWYYFDDSSVSSATEESSVTKAGYVLVYHLRDAAPLHYRCAENANTNAASKSGVGGAGAASSPSAYYNRNGGGGGSGGSSSSNSSNSSLEAETSQPKERGAPCNGFNSSEEEVEDDEMDIN